MVATQFLKYRKVRGVDGSIHYVSVEGKIISELPNYSKNHSEAFKLIRKLRDTSIFCCIDIGTDYHYLWTIKITPGMENSEEDNHEALVCLEGEKFPLIVCNAILEAAPYLKK